MARWSRVLKTADDVGLARPYAVNIPAADGYGLYDHDPGPPGSG
jgi:hypothetical protein